MSQFSEDDENGGSDREGEDPEELEFNKGMMSDSVRNHFFGMVQSETDSMEQVTGGDGSAVQETETCPQDTQQDYGGSEIGGDELDELDVEAKVVQLVRQLIDGDSTNWSTKT